MKRKLQGILCFFGCLFLLTACHMGSGVSENGKGFKEEDIGILAKQLVEEGKYDYPLSEAMTEDNFDMFFLDIPDGIQGMLFVSTTSSAEFVMVFMGQTKEDATAMLGQVEAYLQDSYQQFQKYDAKEAFKLEHRVVEQQDQMVAVVVSADEQAARRMIEDYFED